MANEDELNRLAIQAQLANQQGQTLQSQLEMLQQTITELNTTLDTLRNLKKAKSVSLLPIGSGAFITCQKVDPDEVVLSVGNGIMVTKKADEAADIIEKRIKTVGDAFDRAQRDLIEINKRLQDLNEKAMALSAQDPNVRPA